MATTGASLTLYRYGPLAWFWRAFVFPALIAGLFLFGLALHFGDFVFVLIGLPILAPAVFFGGTVVVRLEVDTSAVEHGGLVIDEDAPLELRATQLGFWTRRIPRERLRGVRMREVAYTESADYYAPRAWVRVRGALPLYFDLLGHIPYPRALSQALGLRANAIRQRGE